MLKLTVAVLAIVLAGTASAAGWRDLRIDASSAASYSAPGTPAWTSIPSEIRSTDNVPYRGAPTLRGPQGGY